jgi:hypothetical protein
MGGGAKTMPSARKTRAKTEEFSEKYDKSQTIYIIYTMEMLLSSAFAQ